MEDKSNTELNRFKFHVTLIPNPKAKGQGGKIVLRSSTIISGSSSSLEEDDIGDNALVTSSVIEGTPIICLISTLPANAVIGLSI